MARWISLLVLLCLAIAAAQSPSLLSVQEETALGRETAKELTVRLDARPEPRLATLGAALLKALPTPSPFTYTFAVCNPPEPPLAEMPGLWPPAAADQPLAVSAGFVFVPRPLLDQPDPVLAAWLAHAIAHIEARSWSRFESSRQLSDRSIIPAPVQSTRRARARDFQPVAARYLHERQALYLARDLLRRARFPTQPLTAVEDKVLN